MDESDSAFPIEETVSLSDRGLSKREYFVAAALASWRRHTDTPSDIADSVVKIADAIIERLKDDSND